MYPESLQLFICIVAKTSSLEPIRQVTEREKSKPGVRHQRVMEIRKVGQCAPSTGTQCYQIF